MKIPLELNFCSKKDIYLNFWDHEKGQDIIAEIRNGKLFLQEITEEGEEPTATKEITVKQFIDMVVKVVKKNWK